jgi:hypothetical protein
MTHLYLFTLEVGLLEVGRAYDELPSHLTLMSRFLSDLPPEELAAIVRPLFAEMIPVSLVFGETVELGPKKVTAHMASGPKLELHRALRKVLDTVEVEYQYPQFIGDGYKPHVTAREGVQFEPGDMHIASASYLVEVVDKKRVIRSRFELGAA